MAGYGRSTIIASFHFSFSGNLIHACDRIFGYHRARNFAYMNLNADVTQKKQRTVNPLRVSSMAPVHRRLNINHCGVEKVSCEFSEGTHGLELSPHGRRGIGVPLGWSPILAGFWTVLVGDDESNRRGDRVWVYAISCAGTSPFVSNPGIMDREC